MTQLPGQRNRTIDAAKGIGIYLVVLGHLNTISALQVPIYSFHMPLFYIISGMLFCKEKYPSFGAFFKKRFRTLIIPYLIFSFISLLIWIVLTLYPLGFTRENTSTIISYFVQIFIDQDSSKPCNTPLWFVPNLFLVECIYYFVSCIKSKPAHWLTILVLAALGWYTESAYCPVDFSFLPWNASSALFALGLYAIGNHFPALLMNPIPAMEKKAQIPYRLLVFAVCFAVLVPLARYNGGVSFGRRELRNGFVFYATGLLGTVGVLSLSSLLQPSRLLNFCGRNSFYIMATHRIFQVLFREGSRLIFHISFSDLYERWGLPFILLFSVVIKALCMLFALYYGKLVQSIHDRRSR